MTKPQKSFSSLPNGGFQIKFPNGLILSTIFGAYSFSSNRDEIPKDGPITFGREWESDDAEIAIISDRGFITAEFDPSAEGVLGHVRISQWIDAFHFCLNWKEKKK